MMRLDDFLLENRLEIIDRCRRKVSARRAPRPTEPELEHGIPTFLDQLIETLRLHLDNNPDAAGIATKHGKELLAAGFTVAQVVHDYGDVCQSVTDLAIERDAPISNEDFRILNRCLDDAIADAVTEYARVRDVEHSKERTEQVGVLAHEVRNIASSVTLAFEFVKSGRVGLTGATGAVLERSLARLNALVARALAEARLESGPVHRARVEVAKILEEVELATTLGASSRTVILTVPTPTVRGLSIEIDLQIVVGILINLVQNAIKFTPAAGHVTLSARTNGDRVCIDVEDECGGLSPSAAAEMFLPFDPDSKVRNGVGLGLTIARRGAHAHGGAIQVRDVPGTGCVVTFEVPRAP